jgi:hypothetical protein
MKFVAIVAGIVQTLLYADFFYLYVTKGESTHSSTGHDTDFGYGYSSPRQEAPRSAINKLPLGACSALACPSSASTS